MVDDLSGRELGGFRLSSLLGAGAHGSVWRANQLRLDREVAVKVLDPLVARDVPMVRRFEREGRAAASLDHPNVVPVYEAGEQDGLVYLAMRFVDGPTLGAHLQDSGPVTPTEAVRLLAPVASALDHAHGRGLVHRDVKPSNILLEGDRVWLADFGIAASLRDIGNYTTGVLGTAEFMAPEQVNAGDVDHRADLYGLGCVAYDALTGEPPFPGTDLIATLMAHVNQPVPTTGNRELDAFFAIALAKDPDDRFSSGADLIDGLIAASQPTTTQPATSQPATSQTQDPAERDLSSSPAKTARWPLVAGIVGAIVAALIATIFVMGGEPSDTQNLEANQTAAAASDTDTETFRNSADGDTSPSVIDDEPNDSDEAPLSATEDKTQSAIPLDVLLEAGGTVEVGTTRSLRTLNPHVDRLIEPFISTHVLPTLVTVNADWSLSPSLATALPVVTAADPFTVRWELRTDARWNDGTPVSSADIARTFEYLVDPDSGATGTRLYEDASLRIISDQVFEMVFTNPTGGYDVLFSTVHPIIQATAYDAHLASGEGAETFLADGISFSAGPYNLAGFDAGERLTLVRNDSYWGEPALLDRVTVRTYDSASSQLDALEQGELDLVHVEDARATDAARARRFADTTVDVGIADQFLRLEMNTRRGPLGDVLVRQAIGAALDRSLIAESAVTPITGEVSGPLQSLVWPTSSPANTNPFSTYGGDAASAKALLQDAGWELGAGGARFKDGEVLEITLKSLEGAPLAEQTLVQSLVVQLLNVGIRVVSTVHSDAELFALRSAGDVDIVIAQDVTNADPIAAVFRFGSQYCPTSFGAAGCISDVPFNLTGISDAALDAALAATAVATVPEQREALFVQVDERLAELVPALPLYELPSFVAYSDRLGGVSVDTHRGGPFAEISGWGFVAPPELD